MLAGACELIKKLRYDFDDLDFIVIPTQGVFVNVYRLVAHLSPASS
jgi:hypothetical protein